MQFAIISDIHYPRYISQQSVLYEKSGYTDEFYVNFEKDLQHLTENPVDAVIINGDLYWDLTYFAQPPIIPPDGDFDIYNNPMRILQRIRKVIPPHIPLILTRGNHDSWFNTYLATRNGKLMINRRLYQQFLRTYFRLSEAQGEKVLESIKITHETMVLGNNVYFLENQGIIVNGVYIYGCEFYDKTVENLTWARFRDEKLQIFHGNLIQLQEINSELPKPTPTLFLQHHHPRTIPLLMKKLQKEPIDLKYLFWGHFHAPPPKLVEECAKYPKIKSSLPELNHLRMQFYQI